MLGWLVVNEFLQSNKFNEIHDWLQTAAKRQGISLKIRTNGELLIDLNSDEKNKKLLHHNRIQTTSKPSNPWDSSQNPDFILFWDKDVRLARHLEQLGYLVMNCASAIEICDDKSYTHQILMAEGIPMPRTIIAPKTYENIGYTKDDFLDLVSNKLKFPMVVKECFGSFGQQVYLVHSLEELRSLVHSLGAKPIIFQEFIQYSSGKDLRLQVVGDKVIASMYRYSINGDFRANITMGGLMSAHEPSKEEIDLALQCCKIIGLDYAGVDLLFGENGKPIVCEVNSNAHFKSIYDCTGINAADAIMAHVQQRVNF